MRCASSRWYALLPALRRSVEDGPSAAETAQSQPLAFCTSCGAQLEPNQRFCESCGTPVGADAPLAVPTGHASASPWTEPKVLLAAGAVVVALIIAVIVLSGSGDKEGDSGGRTAQSSTNLTTTTGSSGPAATGATAAPTGGPKKATLVTAVDNGVPGPTGAAALLSLTQPDEEASPQLQPLSSRPASTRPA